VTTSDPHQIFAATFLDVWRARVATAPAPEDLEQLGRALAELLRLVLVDGVTLPELEMVAPAVLERSR
jgi:hypothetical protein